MRRLKRCSALIAAAALFASSLIPLAHAQMTFIGPGEGEVAIVAWAG